MTSRAGAAAQVGYQGWRNYETWAAALWLHNERVTYDYWRDVARQWQRHAVASDEVRQGTWTPHEMAQSKLADQLREEFEAAAPLDGPDVYADLLRGALSEVDWSEMASSLLEEDEETSGAWGERETVAPTPHPSPAGGERQEGEPEDDR